MKRCVQELSWPSWSCPHGGISDLGRSCMNVAGMLLTEPRCGSQMAPLMGKRLATPTLLGPSDRQAKHSTDSTMPFDGWDE